MLVLCLLVILHFVLVSVVAGRTRGRTCQQSVFGSQLADFGSAERMSRGVFAPVVLSNSALALLRAPSILSEFLYSFLFIPLLFIDEHH